MNQRGSLCQRDHLISITNFEPNTKVSYPIIIIKGSIRNTASCKRKIEIEHVNGESTILKTKFNVNNSQFKCLIELLPQNNKLTLSYCNSSIAFCIDYERSNLLNVVTPVLIICNGHNGEIFAPKSYSKSIESSCERLILGMKLMQSFFAEKLHENNTSRKTFAIEYQNDRPKCIVHQTKLHLNEASKMTEEQLWQYLAKDLITSVHGSRKRKYLAFLTCSKFTKCKESFLSYDIIKQNTKCYASLGKGNFALIGNPFFYTWPQKLIDVLERFEDSTTETFVTGEHKTEPLINSIGGCYSIAFGAAIHELAHMFDLGHTQYGLMGREYIAVDKVFSFGRYDINPQAPYSLSKKVNENTVNKSVNKISFTSIKKPVILETKNQNYANLDQFSAEILFCHKWFNNHVVTSEQASLFMYESSVHKLKSMNSICIVQLRHLINELVEHNFKPTLGCHEWVMPEKYFNSAWYLFAIDNLGNIFRYTIH